MRKYTNVIFNNSSSLELGLLCTNVLSISSPVRVTKDITIAGRETLVEDTDIFEDIEISIEFNYKKSTREKDRRIRKWLTNIEDRYLRFSDDGYVYKVKKVIKEGTERNIFKKGIFTVTFLCEGLQYDIESLESNTIENNSVIYNDGDVNAKPVIQIFGEGLVKLMINDNEITINVGQNITINSELQLCYREDGTLRNADMKGEFPLLETGLDNTISWEGNVTELRIQTNIRYI